MYRGAIQYARGAAGRSHRPGTQSHRPPTQFQKPLTQTWSGPGRRPRRSCRIAGGLPVVIRTSKPGSGGGGGRGCGSAAAAIPPRTVAARIVRWRAFKVMQPPCVEFPLQPVLIKQATCHASPLFETRIPDIPLAETVFILPARGHRERRRKDSPRALRADRRAVIRQEFLDESGLEGFRQVVVETGFPGSPQVLLLSPA